MSRVLMVSMGVPAYVAARRHGGPGLRAAHFAHALSRAGVDVLALCVCTSDELGAASAAQAGPERVQTVLCDERELLACGGAGHCASALGRRIDRFAPDALVGVTAYAAALALRLQRGLPLWADVFGDLLCEAQAKAASSGSDWSLVHFWSLLRPVLEGADRFSAVSVAQSHALVGQLGLAGRLSASTAGEDLVTVIPCAAEADGPPLPRQSARRELGLPPDAFVLLWSGGFNTWCDVETAAAAVAAALVREESLHLVVSGGAIAGHDEHSFERFRQRLERSLQGTAAAGRAHLLGWMDSTRLPSLYAACDLGLNVERPLYERRLGAENRVAEWQAHGLPCLTTALSEAGQRLVERRLAWRAPVGDVPGLAACIGELAASRAAVRETGERARAAAATELRFDVTASPLSLWCLAPRTAGDCGAERFVRLGLMSRPQLSTELLEAYVKELPFSELVRRGVRWSLRRALEATGSAARRRLRGNGRL